jgi:hypothetical protein
VTTADIYECASQIIVVPACVPAHIYSLEDCCAQLTTMSSSAQELLDHLDALANFFKSMETMPSALIKARGAQIASLKAALGRSVLTVRDATALNIRLASMDLLTNEEKSELTDLIVEKLQHAPAATSGATTMNGCSDGGRKGLQDYSAFVNYFTEDVWADIMSDSCSASHKMMRILTHLVKLGLANPAEPTMQCITAMFLLTSEQSGVENMQAAMRLTTLQALKDKLRHLAATTGARGPHVAKLPIVPGDFKNEFPFWWEHAFGDSSPTMSKIGIPELMDCMKLIPMRRSRSDAKQTTMQVMTNSHMPPPQQMHQFAAGMVQQMHQMQEMQKMTFQMIASGSTGGLDSNNPFAFSSPSSSHAMMDKPSKVLQRLSTRLALLDVPPVSPDAAAHEEPERPQPPVEKRKAEDEPIPEQPASKKKSVLDAIEAVRSSMEARSVVKAAAKEKAGKEPDAANEVGKAKPAKKEAKKEKASDGAKQTPKKGKVETVLAANPTWGWERTRSQIVCRTGLKGAGQTHTIKYSDKNDAKKAEKKADAWLVAQRKKFGLK